MSACRGRTATGGCDKTAKYLVRGVPACGLHLAQIVKAFLEVTHSVDVKKLP